MNLNQLALFHAVAQEGSVSRGAEKLCISQPAVSKQLREFEKSLGVALFHRLSSGVRLTEAGTLLFEYSNKLFTLEKEAENALQELRALERGRLIVGASTTIGTHILPAVCAQFGAKYPKIELHLEISNSDDVQRRLIAGEIDLGLSEGVVSSPEIEVETFAHDEIVAIVAHQHELTRAEVVTVDDLLRFSILLRERGSGTRAVVEAVFAARGITLQPTMSLGSSGAIVRAVSDGVGVAFVSRLAIEGETRLRVLDVPDLQIVRPLQRLRVRGRYEARVAREFARMLRTLPFN